MGTKRGIIMSQLRLDKFLADAGIGSRSQVKQYLKTGQITVNGTVIKTGNIKILPDTDLILYQGNPVVREPHVYYMLNKPAGYVSAVKDDRFPTVISLINDPSHPDLFPVGRLDKDTEGLLLITNDGALAHRLLSPKKHVDKTYYTEFRGNLPEDAATQFQQGIDIGDKKPTMPALLQTLSESSALLTIQEGRFHQVKRMFQAFNCEVTYLKRIRMGILQLDDTLPPGASRLLTPEELAAL